MKFYKVDNFLTTSDGERVENPNFYKNLKKRLAKEQRTLSLRALQAHLYNKLSILTLL